MSSTSAIEAGRAFVAIFAKDETKKELKQIGARFKAWGAGIAATGGAMVAASAAATAAMASAVSQFTTLGGDLADASARSGMAAAALQEIGFAAGQSGASMADLEVGLKHLVKQTGKSGEAAFLATADAIAAIQDPGKQAQMALQMFGEAGLKLLPLLRQGSAAIQKYREEARLMGITLTESDIDAADNLGDALAKLNATFRGIALQVGAAIAPLVKFAVDGLQPIATTIVRVIKENRGLVQGFAIGVAIFGAVGGVLLVVGGALAGVGALLAALPAIVTGVSAAVGIMSTVIGAVLSPIGLVVAAVVALAAALAALGVWFMTSTTAGQQFTAFLTAGFKQLWSVASQTFKGIADALMAGNLALAGKVAMSALKVAWSAGIAGLKIAWANFTNYIVSSMLSAVTKAALIFDTIAKAAGSELQIGGGIGKLTDAANALVKSGNANLVSKSQADLNKAFAEWQAALKEAKDGKAKTEAAAKLTTLDLPTPAVMGKLASSMAGSFSGFAAGLLGRAGGGTPEERTAKAAEALLGKMDELIDAVEDGGGVEFAGAG